MIGESAEENTVSKSLVAVKEKEKHSYYKLNSYREESIDFFV